MSDEVFDRAMHLARQRAQMLAYANHPDAPTHRADEQIGPTTRRQMLARARKVERLIADLADWSIRDARMKAIALGVTGIEGKPNPGETPMEKP